MTTGAKVPDDVRQEIIRLSEEDHLSGNQIAKRVGISRSKTQDILHAWQAGAQARNGQGHDSTPAAVVDVPLDAIHLTGETQARNAINEYVVNEYAEAMAVGEHFPPVILFHDAEGYWVGDGHHRCRAARQVGFTTIQAEVREGGPREAFLYACAANTRHGLRRTDLDKRQVVHILLMDEEWGQWSDREIARQCAVSHPFVGKLRAELAERRARRSGSGYQMTETRTVRRGESTYTMDTSGIGTREVTTDSANGKPVTFWQDAEDDEEIAPPVACRSGYEDSLDDLHTRMFALVEAIEQAGGIKVVWRAWIRDRQQEFLESVARIEGVWTRFTAEARQAAPQAPLTLVSAKEADPAEAQP